MTLCSLECMSVLAMPTVLDVWCMALVLMAADYVCLATEQLLHTPSLQWTHCLPPTYIMSIHFYL